MHEFCRYKIASFFSEEPPPNMSPGFRGWLAGVAELMCLEFDLKPIPEWISRPEFFLAEEFDPGSKFFPWWVP
jgi:hypothetical protein